MVWTGFLGALVWRRPHREGEGRLLLSEAFISQDLPLACASPPVHAGMGAPRRAGGHALRCLRVPIRTKARIFPADQAWLRGPWHEGCPRPSLRVPSDTGRGVFAGREDGQYEPPVRPAVGVSSTQARTSPRVFESAHRRSRADRKASGVSNRRLAQNPLLHRAVSRAVVIAEEPALPF